MKIINKVIKYKIARPYYASKFYRKLLSEKKDNEAFLITSYQIGDMIYALAYVEALKRRLEVENKNLIIYLADNRKNFLSLYDIDIETRFWDHNDMKVKKYMQHLNLSPRYVAKGLKHDIYTAIAPCILKDYQTNKRDCLAIIRDNMYRVSHPQIVYPKLPGVKIESIPDFESIKGRVAVLNQYSNALKDRLEVFDEISEYLISKGYIVYSNVINDQIPSKGSKPLTCGILEFYEICNYVPLVVSIRSGIIDFCISANTRFFVIYPDRRRGDGFFDVYTLKAWQTKNVIEEIFHVDNANTMEHFIDFVKFNNLLQI